MIVASCAWFASAGVQAQKPRVVVMDFTGSGGPTARGQVIRALRDRVIFERQSAATEVLASRGAKVTSVEGRSAIARGLSLDYVLWGRVRGRGNSARAEIHIAGPRGKEIAARRAGPPGQAKGNERIRKATRTLLAEAIKVAPPAQAAAAAEAVVVPEIRITLGGEPESVKKVEQVAKAEKAKKEPEPAEAEKREQKESPEEREPRSSDTAPGPVVAIFGGAGGRARHVKINVDDGAGGTATREYKSGVYLDIVFRLELRPLARNDKKGLRGLALEADADFGVGLETTTQGSSARLDTKAWRILGQLGYFHSFGKNEIGGLAGIGFDALDIEDNGTLPSIRYLFLRVGPAYRYLFIERTLYLRVDAGFRWPFSYGELAETFGDAKGFGFDAGLMLGGQLDVGFSYAIRVSSDLFLPKFSAFPEGMLPGRPAAAQGKDGTDVAINFHAMVGWSF